MSTLEADLTLLRLRELLVEIAQENRVRPDIIEKLRTAVAFGGPLIEKKFNRADFPEGYQTPDERLKQMQAARRAKRKKQPGH